MVNVLKANGMQEPFSQDKIRLSVNRVGVPANIQDKLISHVESKLYEDIPTKEVYQQVNEFLQKETHLISAIKYKLKQSLMELGPTGYPFEDFVSETLKAKGYLTQTRSVLMGKCVGHEIDVIAEKKGIEKLMIEAKFHNDYGIHTDVHVQIGRAS